MRKKDVSEVINRLIKQIILKKQLENLGGAASTACRNGYNVSLVVL